MLVASDMRSFFIFAMLIAGVFVLSYAFWKQRGTNTTITIALAAYLVLVALGIAFYDTLTPETIKLSSGGIEVGLRQLNDAKNVGLEEIRKEAESQKLALRKMQEQVARQEESLQAVIKEARQINEHIAPRILSDGQRKRLITELSKYSGYEIYNICRVGDDPEAGEYAVALKRTIVQAGWKVVTDCESVAGFPVFRGLAILVFDPAHPPRSAVLFNTALIQAGLRADYVQYRNMPEQQRNRFELLVGPKN